MEISTLSTYFSFKQKRHPKDISVYNNCEKILLVLQCAQKVSPVSFSHKLLLFMTHSVTDILATFRTFKETLLESERQKKVEKKCTVYMCETIKKSNKRCEGENKQHGQCTAALIIVLQEVRVFLMALEVRLCMCVGGG